MDLANWMEHLPTSLHGIPLNWLAIPGSHDSFSYTITPDSDVAPDRPDLKFWAAIPFVKKRIIYNWILTQALTCRQQLERGIRYFDFRLAPTPGSLMPHIVHGLYGSSVTEVLADIQGYLLEHKAEIVLLDFQHFYNFTEDVHAWLISHLQTTFGDMLCPFNPSLTDLRLSTLWYYNKRVLVFYRDDHAKFVSWVFPSAWIPNPWPNTVKPDRMIQVLENNYNKGRQDWAFFVNQGILTPTLSYILLRIYSTLIRSLAPVAMRRLLEWLRAKSAGQNGINVVIADDVGSDQFNFSSEVIGLNLTLAERIPPA